MEPPRDAPGAVYWLTGLAGAGKTTLARALAARLRERGRPVVVLDGDRLRATLFPEVGHAPEERLALARRYAALCELVAREGVDVVCATISLFPEVWAWNRERLPGYREVLVRAPEAVRAARRPELYRDAEQVVGRDLPAPEPPAPHAVVENDGARDPGALADALLDRLVSADGR